jgi:putative transposase
MRRQYRRWTLAEKRSAVEQMAVCGHGKLAKELGISTRQLYTWRAYVARLMADDNLVCLRRRRFAVTTDSGHQLRVHLNLAAHLELTGIDQLWVADITYIRLAEQFLYLAVVLDAYSRRVVGWALDQRLDAALAVGALRQAIDARQPAPGLVHHSDRGVQYASAAYAALLQERASCPP